MSVDVSVILGVAGAAASILGSLLTEYFKQKKRGKETLETRIEKLTSALQESSRLVSEVEREIASRRDLVAELRRDADKYQNLVSLNRDQVDAVAQLLQGELRKEGNKSFWRGAALNFVFFAIGAAISWVASRGI
jgi:hypothetical protein